MFNDFYGNIEKVLVSPFIQFCEIRIDTRTKVFYVFDSINLWAEHFNMALKWVSCIIFHH